MPIYEEKVISPFALHFTQEHIKTLFQDGRVVEDTVPEIKVEPADGEHFDIILKAPFPNIEILRWHPLHSDDSKEAQWFTLDNRRLYCLQRMAAEHWPKRVGALVDILYADPGRIRKKYDSSTEGRSVTISPSVKVAAISRWDWRVTVAQRKAEAVPVARALETVRADCAKPTVSELCNVPPPAFESVFKDQTASLVSMLAASLGARRAAAGEAETSPTESTAASEAESSSSNTPREDTSKEPKDAKLVWRPKSGAAAEDKVGSGNSELEEEVIELVRKQLAQPGRKGFVWIDQWNEKYQKQLGNLRAFLESQPDVFTVKPGKGRSYRVEAVCAVSAPEKSSGKWRRSGRSNRAR
mmetsp:Transcript_11667/g.27528  ORF Transcript_11667/g.27528 Transcript_11667/m.27528 type:complete len:355 (+) Transcript_11667:127-1191(+)